MDKEKCTNWDCMVICNNYENLLHMNKNKLHSDDMFARFLLKYLNGEDLSKPEMVKEFRKFLDLKDANALANKLLALQNGRICNMPNCGV